MPLADSESRFPQVVIIMGVSGAGKSTIGTLLAEKLHWKFEDADSFHPPANVEKMRKRIPLNDDDRKPWLEAIAKRIDEILAAGEHGVITCSALRRRYRDILIDGRKGVRLVHLQGTEPVIARRMAARQDHFMPTSLLRSQFEALEQPTPDENPVVVSIEPSPIQIVDKIISELKAG